mmetsp:Transcript_34598/g.85802  ORF Transcript_34598/g.85802 Transcript_34598/m.85802 type:complete len:93 (-) Transcript_34598:277-555(-)
MAGSIHGRASLRGRGQAVGRSVGGSVGGVAGDGVAAPRLPRHAPHHTGRDDALHKTAIPCVAGDHPALCLTRDASLKCAWWMCVYVMKCVCV